MLICARIDAFNILAERCGEFTYAQLLPLVCNSLYFMADEEMAIRSGATYAMLAVLRHIATPDGSTVYSRWESLTVVQVRRSLRAQ